MKHTLIFTFFMVCIILIGIASGANMCTENGCQLPTQLTQEEKDIVHLNLNEALSELRSGNPVDVDEHIERAMQILNK